MDGSWYDTAQICTNGHVINSCSVSRPEHNKKFCDKCRAPTITKCPKCNTAIRGRYHEPLPKASMYVGGKQIWQSEEHFMGTLNYTDLPLPSSCPDCGKPYPWTEAKLKAAQELADELDNLSPEEHEMLKKSLDDIIQDTPQTAVAATRFKRLAAKVGKIAAEQLRKLVVDIASETAKKIILE